MKIIDRWRDKELKFENIVYQFRNGVKMLLTINPSTVEFNFSVVVKGGSYYERQVGVPHGTAHFLEHMLFGNPNKKFKNRQAMDRYTYGSRYRAEIYDNAVTSRQFISFYGHANETAAIRVIKDIRYRLDYPLSQFEKFIEKERNVILGEISRTKKEERNSSIQFEKYFWGDIYPEFSEYVLGTNESVKTITAEDLRKYYHAIMRHDNVIITLQTSEKLTLKLKQELKTLADLFTSPPHSLEMKKHPIDTKFRFNHFHDDDEKGIFFSVNYFYKYKTDINYKRDAMYSITSDLMWKVGHEYLREQKELIYDPGIINSKVLPNYKDRGLTIQCSKENFAVVLEETYNCLYKYWREFLLSKEGIKWLESRLSRSVFPTNNNFHPSYSQELGMDVLDGEEYKFDFNEYKKQILSITVDDLANFYDEFVKSIPSFWFYTPYKDEEIYEVFKNSHFYKEFAQLNE